MRRSPTHPGEILLKEWLEHFAYGAQAKAADEMGMTRNQLNEILKGKRAVTAETAVLIGALTLTDPRLWLNLQADYDIWRAIQASRDRLKKIRPLTAIAAEKKP